MRTGKEKARYDWLVVGAGLFGCVCARELIDKGYRVLVIDRRGQVGGNCAVKAGHGQTEHMYGPHIFHTNDKAVWDYLNDIEPFVPYRHSVIAVNGGLQYDFPINRNTLNKVFGDNAALPPPDGRIPRNFEEAAIAKVGNKLYNLFYRDYTAKQWGCDPMTLPAGIFGRVPVRYDYNDSYFNDTYTGVMGSNRLFEKLLKGATIKLNCAYDKRKHGKSASRIIYTGMVDEYYGYCLGALPYRSLRFERRKVEPYSNQGTAVVNYTDARPYTRTCEYGYMYGGRQEGGSRWYEYPIGERDKRGRKVEPYYPIPTKEAQALYDRYMALSGKGARVFFGGRLGSYKYLNMDRVVEQALELTESLKQIPVD